MIRILYIATMIISGLSGPVYSQFIQFSIEVEPEVEVITEAELNFGAISTTDSVRINFGDVRMGIMSISGVRNQELTISAILPEYLQLTFDPECELEACRLTTYLDLMFSYDRNASSFNDVLTAVNLSQPSFQTRLAPPGSARPDLVNLYVFVTGAVVSRGAISGNYEGDLTILIEY